MNSQKKASFYKGLIWCLCVELSFLCQFLHVWMGEMSFTKLKQQLVPVLGLRSDFLRNFLEQTSLAVVF